jgi:hypothetical protein
MALPDSRVTLRDGALGIVASDNSRVGAKVGCSSAGTINTPLVTASPQLIKDTFGAGPLVEAALYHLAIAGGPVMLVKTPSSTAGSVGSLTPVKTGTATLAATGAALDAGNLVVTIIQGGATLAAATATFKYSVDGGKTYSAEIAIQASGVYVITTYGITLTWTYTSGTAFVAGDSWTAVISGPGSTNTEITDAIDAVVADPTLVFNIHVLGIASSAANAATLAATLETKMNDIAVNKYRAIYATIEVPSDTDANIKTAFASYSGVRVEVPVGPSNVYSPSTTATPTRPLGWVSSARAAAVAPQEDIGRFASGPLKGVTGTSRDEYKTQGLDALGFTTIRTFTDEPGFYLTMGRIKAPAGSDFGSIARRRVMDLAYAAVRKAQLRYINEQVEVGSDGKITEAAGDDIDARLDSFVRSAIVGKGYAVDIQVAMDRSINILTTESLRVVYRVRPFGYSRYVEGDLGFANPNTALAA